MAEMTPHEAAEKLSYDSLENIIFALDAMYNSKKMMRKADYWSRCAGEAASILRKVTAKELVPLVHAHWIKDYSRFRCSSCHEVSLTDNLKYCPYCGALMEEFNHHAEPENKAFEQLKVENAQLRAVITQSDQNFFKRKCRVCGCDWNHPCNNHDYWVKDDLCSACALRLKNDDKLTL